MTRPSDESELVLYQTEDGITRLHVRLVEGTVWLTQRQLANLYQVTVPAISQHIAHIFEEGELAPEATIKSYLTVRTEGNRSVSRPVEHYSLPVVLAVGYRVRSPRGPPEEILGISVVAPQLVLDLETPLSLSEQNDLHDALDTASGTRRRPSCAPRPSHPALGRAKHAVRPVLRASACRRSHDLDLGTVR